MAIKKSELYSSIWKSCDELRGDMMPRSIKTTFWYLNNLKIRPEANDCGRDWKEKL